MPRYNDDFREQPREGVTRYVLWTLAVCLLVGAFLHADGFFDDLIDETTSVSGEPADSS